VNSNRNLQSRFFETSSTLLMLGPGVWAIFFLDLTGLPMPRRKAHLFRFWKIAKIA
jgi:hypothetical protein